MSVVRLFVCLGRQILLLLQATQLVVCRILRLGSSTFGCCLRLHEVLHMYWLMNSFLIVLEKVSVVALFPEVDLVENMNEMAGDEFCPI